MTPAEQIRATMALLEAVSAPKDNAAVVDQLFNMAIDVPELDEGIGGRSILVALIAAAGMSLASGAQAADPVQDAACAAALAVLSNVDHARGQISSVAPARAAAEKLALRAGQNGLTGQAFESKFTTVLNNAKTWVETGKEGELRDYAKNCINTLKSEPAQAATGSSAREQEIERSNREWEAKNKNKPAAQTQQSTPAQTQASAPAVNSYQIKRDAMDAASAMKQGNTNMRDNIANRYRNDPQAWAQFKQEYNSWASAIR